MSDDAKRGASWTFDVPNDVVKNDWMSKVMYEYAAQQLERLNAFQRDFHAYHGHPGEYGAGCKLCFPPVTWRQWLAGLWDDWRPRVHFGPCDHSECE